MAVEAALQFQSDWRAKVLAAPPLIAPARQFTYPLRVSGEEDAMARGALLIEVQPAVGGTFLATCALGFTNPAMPTAVHACPRANEMCSVAGGYAYVIDTAAPERCTQIPLKPVTEVLVAVEQGLLIFVGFHAIAAWGREGMAWESARLSWEGVRISGVEGHTLHGIGWNMPMDKEVAFSVDLQTGAHVGGGF